MKRILIVSHAMELGGAETALLGLLENIDTDKYEVDLFLLRHSGELMRYIPRNIKLLPEIPQYASLAVPISQVIKKGQWKVALGRLVGKYKAKKCVKKFSFSVDNGVAIEYSHKYTKAVMPSISDVEYDFAISFLTPHYFVSEKVNAKKKIAWIHTDYDKVEVDVQSELVMWSKFNHIISISDSVTDSFIKIFPSLQEKVVLIENILPIQYITARTKECSVEDEMPSDGAVKLLSIGRFSHAKKFDEIPQTCKRVRKLGIDVKWYLIGFGGDENLIRQKIQEADMEQYVIILGKKENPYPYIKVCDIYLQPSRYEGKSVAVREAQALNKPVIITNYATAKSQLKDGYDGVIVSMEIEESARQIAKIISDKDIQNKLVENTKKSDYTNAGEIKKLYEILEDRG